MIHFNFLCFYGSTQSILHLFDEGAVQSSCAVVVVETRVVSEALRDHWPCLLDESNPTSVFTKSLSAIDEILKLLCVTY